MSLSRRQFVGAIGTAPLLTAAARAAAVSNGAVPMAPTNWRRESDMDLLLR